MKYIILYANRHFNLSSNFTQQKQAKMFASISVILLCGLLIFTGKVNAAVKLPRLIDNGMVLQRSTILTIWGWADEGEKVKIKFRDKEYTTSAGTDKKWEIKLPSMPAGGPYTMTISGTNEISLNDILIGDVFICSGQSNMEVGMAAIYSKEAETSLNPNIRHFKVKHNAAKEPLEDVETEKSWQSAKPSTVKGFSAVAYFFARDLYEKYHVPIGLINCSWSGTLIEQWISPEGLMPFPNYDLSIFYPAKPEKNPAALYQGLINPLLNCSFTGILWYQGEFNKGRAYEYRTLFPALIKDWRSKFKKGDFPFVFVQLPNYDPIKPEGSPSEVAELREAQAMALSVPNTAMVVTVETNSTTALHPMEKKPIGERLSLAVQKLIYKEKIVAAGPVFKSYEIQGNKVILTFSDTGRGLMSKNGELQNFTIAGADQKFKNAKANITGKKTIEVSSPDVTNPVSVRYAWADCPVGANLYNQEGLPAGTFRTDNWPGVTVNRVGHTPVQK